MAAPTNIDAASAIELGPLPNTIIQDVNDGGTTYTVWYKYTAVAGDNVLGGFFFGDLIAYAPGVVAWTGPLGSLTEVPTPSDPFYAQNVPFQIPVTPGEDYYFQVFSSGGNVTPASLTLSLLRHADVAAPIGSLFINDDTTGLPLAILSQTDGSVLRFQQNFPAGDNGAILNTGRLVVVGYLNDVDPAAAYIYDDQLTLLATVPMSATSPTSSNKIDKFYFVDPTSGVLTILDQDGVAVPTTVSIGAAVRGIGVALDESVLYYMSLSGVNQPIKQWDLATNLPLANLAPGIAGYVTCKDILVLDDDSIVVLYKKSAAPTDVIGKRYDPTGVVLNTYTILASGAGSLTDHRLGHALDDPISFWAYAHVRVVFSDQYSVIQNIRAADGVVLTGFNAAEFESCVATIPPTATPTDRFGHSESCPFFILRVAIVPNPPPPIPTGSTLEIRALLDTGLMPISGYAGVRIADSIAAQGLAPGARLDRYPHALRTHQPTYADVRGQQPLGNPSTADRNGYFTAYVVPEPLDLQFVRGGIPAPYTIADALVLDPRVLTLINLVSGLQGEIPLSLFDLGSQSGLLGIIGIGVPLGGSLTFGLQSLDLMDAIDALAIPLTGANLQGVTALAVCTLKTDDAATLVTPVLYNESLGEIAAQGSQSNSTTGEFQSFTVPLTAAASTYRFRLQASNADSFVYGNGYLFLTQGT